MDECITVHQCRGTGAERGAEAVSLSGLGRAVSLTTVSQQEERPIRQILYLGNLLETCHFQSFWVNSVFKKKESYLVFT